MNKHRCESNSPIMVHVCPTWCINTSYIPLTEQHELEEWMLFCLVNVTYMSPLATHCHHPLTLSRFHPFMLFKFKDLVAKQHPTTSDEVLHLGSVASSPGHSQILSRSCGEKSGEGLGSKLHHGPEMVDLVSTNRVHGVY